MKEEKVGQEVEELELIDFDTEIEEPIETITESTEEISQNKQKEENVIISKTEKIVGSMQNFVERITAPAPVEKTSSFQEVFNKASKYEKPIDKIKVLWAEKRTRALMTLLLWIIFMVVIVAIIRSNITVTPIDKDEPGTIDSAITTLSNMNNYDYSIVLVSGGTTKTIAGSYFENRALFNYNNEQYYFENNIYSIVKNSKLEPTTFELEIDLNNLSPFAIANILENSELTENTTNTNGAITARSYKIAASKILDYLYNTTIATDEEIKIDVRYTDNQISSLEINMEDITDLQPENKQVGGIHVEYRNIGKVSATDVAYDMTEFDMGLESPDIEDTTNGNNEGE